LEGQADYLQRMSPEKSENIKQMKSVVESKFESLKAPLLQRQNELFKKKEAFQFRRDVEDEKLWIAEKMPLATSTDYGTSLYTVLTQNKKLQSLTTEVENHEPRIQVITCNGLKLIEDKHADSDEFKRLLDELKQAWVKLMEALDHRRGKLAISEKAQQYLFDANEAEVWMSEQELYMMNEDTGKDVPSAQNLIKKHQGLEGAVDLYAETIRSLGETAKILIKEEHPESEQIGIRQSQIDKLYAGLRDLTVERRHRLDESLRLYTFKREVSDLEQWISEREVVASSQELGQDYEHVMNIKERFSQFAAETEAQGQERITAANEGADRLIDAGHSDAPTVAQWKDTVNDAFAELLELIETRKQMLDASWELHKFFHDCKDTLSRVLEKQHSISDELGRDAGSVSGLQRKHNSFVQDLIMLHTQVQQIQEDSSKLQAAYAGDKAREITGREAEVVSAWLSLQGMCEERRVKLHDTSDLYRLLSLIRILMLWMEDVVRQINTQEKARDVSGVELLMNNHQSLKAEIDAREDNFSQCVMLGKELLARSHYASGEIKEKLMCLSNSRNNMLQKWENRWEHLQLILEVYQFSRDASVAEQWLITQEPYITSGELGRSIDQVESLIKRHEAFDKACHSQEERFAALERLTTFELKELKRIQEEEEADRLKKEEQQREEEQRARDQIDAERASMTSEDKQSDKGDERSSPGEDDVLEGSLVRKHEYEAINKRASNRSWDKVFVVVKGSSLAFYKDSKTYRATPDQMFRGEQPIDLAQSTCQVADDYTKKKNVFRLKYSGGGEFLLQAHDEEELAAWASGIRAAAGGEGAERGGAQTLPAMEKRDEPKKKGFFTMKKK